MVYEVLLVAYLIVALVLVGFVLIQQGKGADMGASFGSGGSNTVFGSSGSGNFMTRTTGILATLFFLISLILGNLTANREESTDGWSDLGSQSQLTVPAEQQSPAKNQDPDMPVTEDMPTNDLPATDSAAPQGDIPAADENAEKGDTPN